MNSRIGAFVALSTALLYPTAAADRKILLIGDKPSHGPSQHEHNADVWLFQKWLNTVPGIHATAIFNTWPEDTSATENADAILIDCDGAEGHELFQGDRAAALQKAAARGVGLMFYHFCVEPPVNRGRREMLDWIGGYFELNYSVNPEWKAHFRSIPQHPITRGVKPFEVYDEWYYNVRFRDTTHSVTPILTAVPPAETFSRPDGIRSGNPDVRAKVGQPQILVWGFERVDGGRGVGFTGGHYHSNLGNENFRKVVLNSLLWVAKMEVPRDGVNVTVTEADLNEYLDPKPAIEGHNSVTRGDAPLK